MTQPRIAIVGHCAAGKSTVVNLLQQRGIDAFAVAQEHSSIQDLWNHQQPDLMVFLDVSLDELRMRKDNPDWPEWIFQSQNERLEHARSNADLVIDTDAEPAEMVVTEILQLVGGGQNIAVDASRE